MKVTRRQTLAALVATIGGFVAKASFLGRFRLMPVSLSDAQDGTRRLGRPQPSRRVERAPHSVKRHA